MKFFIVFACALAAASAGLVGPVVYGAQHLPVIGPNGVPIDTPAVQHATAAHLAHKAEAHARNGDFAVYAHAAPVVAHAAPLAYAAHAHGYAAPVVAAHGIVAAHGHYVQPAAYPTTAVLPASVNGVPLETPEVVAAKSHHFAAHAEALARNGHVAGIHHIYRRGIYAGQVAAYAAPIAYAAQHLPIIGANGVPVDTVEVQHARAAHLAHKVEAHARNGDFAVVAHAAPVVAHHAYAAAAPVVAHHAYAAAPAIVAHGVPAAYPTTLGLPAVTANGIPLETPEVVAAKSNHFAAHSEALARNSPIYSDAIIAAPIATVW